MSITEVIDQLEDLRKRYGDLDVVMEEDGWPSSVDRIESSTLFFSERLADGSAGSSFAHGLAKGPDGTPVDAILEWPAVVLFHD